MKIVIELNNGGSLQFEGEADEVFQDTADMGVIISRRSEKLKKVVLEKPQFPEDRFESPINRKRATLGFKSLPVDYNLLNYEDFMKLLGCDEINATVQTIWHTLATNGFKIGKFTS